MDFNPALQIATSGMRAQGTRLRVVAENIANANTTARSPGATPYRRQLTTFAQKLQDDGSATVVVEQINLSSAPFGTAYDPSHPAADAQGYVLLPNVDPLIELADLRQAQRSYEANLKVLESTQTLLQQTLDLLR